MTPPRIRPWDVWWVDFDPQIGAEQAGTRPAIVVGSLLACRIQNNVYTVVPCTKVDRKLIWQPPVVLENTTTSYAMCDQIKTLSTVRFKGKMDVNLTAAEVGSIRLALQQMILF